MKSLEGLRYLQGPCYLEDSPQHHYSEMVRNVESIKNLNGPIFEIDRKHCFQELIKHTEKIEKLMGPIFQVEHKHNCTEIITNAEVLKEMHHPVLTCDHKGLKKSFLHYVQKLELNLWICFTHWCKKSLLYTEIVTQKVHFHT